MIMSKNEILNNRSTATSIYDLLASTGLDGVNVRIHATVASFFWLHLITSENKTDAMETPARLYARIYEDFIVHIGDFIIEHRFDFYRLGCRDIENKFVKLLVGMFVKEAYNSGDVYTKPDAQMLLLRAYERFHGSTHLRT